MEIHKELNQIASADYGLQLKDPIFAAYSKLVTDPKFELVQNILVDDYAEFEEALRKFNINITLNKTIRNFLDLLVILNGRKGFIAKTGSAHPQGDATYNIAYWIDMLGKELINSGTGVYTDGVDERGSGVVNGSRMRAAMYHILDILQYKYSEFRDYQIVTFESPCCIIGRDMYDIGITATSEDIGYLNPDDNKYYVDVKVKNLWRFKDEQTITIEIGDEPLHKGSFIHKECSPSMPFSLYSISIDSFEGELTLSYYQIREEEITPGAIKVKTGVLPLTFYTVDTSLLDWYLRGSVNGVGKLGKNYLKTVRTPIPNGAAGTLLKAQGSSGFPDLNTGLTFNTEGATRVVFNIKKQNGSTITSSDVGDIMFVKGTEIPTSYDPDKTLYTKGTVSGELYPHNGNHEVGVAQELYCGDDWMGGTHNYKYSTSYLNTCQKTYAIEVEPNTDYSIRLFNSSDIMVVGTIFRLTEPESVYVEVQDDRDTYGGVVNIPSGEPFNTNHEQWTVLKCTANYSNFGVDVRANRFEFCDAIADLKAGTYKLIVEVLGNHVWSGGGLYTLAGFDSYQNCYIDADFSSSGIRHNYNVFERFALIGEDDTLIIPETNVFNSSTQRTKINSDGGMPEAPIASFFHQEYTFTLPRDMKVGVVHRNYESHIYQGNKDTRANPYFRFMICDSDVEAQEFETTGLRYNFSGESMWEPYKYTLPITITNEDGSLAKRVDLDLGDKPLGPNDTIHMTDVDLPIPTFEGWNTLDCLSDTLDKPYAYIRYQQ